MSDTISFTNSWKTEDVGKTGWSESQQTCDVNSVQLDQAEQVQELKVHQVKELTDYSDCCLPAGTPDDVSWGNIWRGDICRVEEGAVVGVVLIQSPFCGILDGLLTFQLKSGNADEAIQVSWIRK